MDFVSAELLASTATAEPTKTEPDGPLSRLALAVRALFRDPK